MRKWYPYLLTILGILLALVALLPSQWLTNLSAWQPILTPIAVIAIIALLSYAAFHARSIRVYSKRRDWWDREIERVIQRSRRLVVIDSYQGTKHGFWVALQRRIESNEPFELYMFRLWPDDVFLSWCREVAGVPPSVADVDEDAIERLRQINAKLPSVKRKNLTFGFWSGVSPGPIVAWTIGSKTSIAFGPWVQVEGSTDLTPWLVVSRGALFEALTTHCDAIVKANQGAA